MTWVPRVPVTSDRPPSLHRLMLSWLLASQNCCPSPPGSPPSDRSLDRAFWQASWQPNSSPDRPDRPPGRPPGSPTALPTGLLLACQVDFLGLHEAGGEPFWAAPLSGLFHKLDAACWPNQLSDASHSTVRLVRRRTAGRGDLLLRRPDR